MTAYVELHALSNFTFLRGASHPEELVQTAAELGYEALALTDECSVSGIVRAHVTAKECGFNKLIVGSEFRLASGLKLVVLARNRAGYAQLCHLITRGRRAAEKGSYQLTAEDFGNGLPDCLVLWVPGNQLLLCAEDGWITEAFADRLWIAVELLADGLERQPAYRGLEPLRKERERHHHAGQEVHADHLGAQDALDVLHVESEAPDEEIQLAEDHQAQREADRGDR